MIRTARWWLLVPMFAVVASAQDAGTDRPAARSDVIDSAKLFPADVLAQSKKRLAAIEEATKIPVTIETVTSLDGQTIEDAALKAARLSGGDGLFIYIAKDERKIAKPLVRRQFEHRFPEEKKAAIREAILEGFKAGDFGDGLKRGIDAIAATLERPAAPAPTATDPAWGLAAPTSASIIRDQARLTLAGARKALAAAEAKAIDLKVRAAIAVVDDAGHLLAFVRMDGAASAKVGLAQTKAGSAAIFREETGPNNDGAVEHPHLGLDQTGSGGWARITRLPGGQPILVDGQVVGAVGVAGGAEEQDAQIARSGVSALAEDVKKPGDKDAPKP